MNATGIQNNQKVVTTNNYFNHVGSIQFNLLTKKGWFLQNDLNNNLYSGYGAGVDQNYWLWNLAVGKKFLKDRKGELKLSVFDLLEQNVSITRDITESYIEDVRNRVLTDISCSRLRITLEILVRLHRHPVGEISIAAAKGSTGVTNGFEHYMSGDFN